MNLHDVTDSLTKAANTPPECPRCHLKLRVGNGICPSCAITAALNGKEGEPGNLAAVLEEIEVKDSHRVLGNYEILEEIGRGGMGVIYRARQRHSRRIVAVKRVLSYYAESRQSLERFRREAEAAANLDHPNILPVYEVSEAEGLPYFSMKYAAGGNLAEVAPALQKDKRTCVALIAKVARAVEYAHRQGILHRDLKPGNILLDVRGDPLVSDFGLAKWLDTTTDLTRTLTVFGTPGYIAPEQAEGTPDKITPAADVYSIGAILFFLLTGRTPFIGENALAVIHETRQKPAPRLRSLNRSVDRGIETICARCLERDPALRYLSAGALANDLERWSEGRPISPRRVLSPSRILRWSRRNPKLAVTGCVSAVLLFLVTWLVTERRHTQKELAEMRAGMAAPEKSVAVLPFDSLGQEPDEAFFASALHNEIITDLTKVNDVKVISQTSVMAYKNQPRRDVRTIAGQLGVRTIVEGTVQRLGNRIRVTAKLVDARNATNIWAQNYDRDIPGLFALQDDIAKSIVQQLQVQLSARERLALSRLGTADFIANQLYLKAKALEASHTVDPSGKDKLYEAQRLVEQAVTRDSQFALAYCLLCEVHLAMFWDGFDHTSSRRELARQALEKAEQLQPDAGEVHLTRAIYLYHGFRDYDKAREELDLARTTIPNAAGIFYYSALIDRRQGRWTEAIRNFNRAIELDPRNVQLLEEAALKGLYSYSKSNELLVRALEISPRDYYIRLTLAQNVFFETGDTKLLRTTIQTILAEDSASAAKIAWAMFFCALAERDSSAVQEALRAMPRAGTVDIGNSIYPRAWYIGLAARVFGDTTTARSAFTTAQTTLKQIVSDQPDYANAWSLLGLIDAGLGSKGQAIYEGRHACELQPLSEDPWGYNWFLLNLAMVYAWTGEKDLAIQELILAAKIKNGATYGDLKVNPQWDALRGDNRFEGLVQSLAPTENNDKVGFDRP
jgi:serine/threonine protein kinase/tetratricopeptide (TPR) repeat protein